MAENTVKAKPSEDANAIESELTDNWVTIKARPTESMERQLLKAVEKIISLKDQFAQMAATLAIVKAQIGELETKIELLESERTNPSAPANSPKAGNRGGADYDERFRTNRELFAKLDAEFLDILREGK